MMEHNLEDSLKLGSAMGDMDFENPGDVVNQSDITLEAGHGEDMQMEFENIEEQQMLMDTGNEEIIGFMGDQFTLQQYSIQEDHPHDVGAMVDANQLSSMSSQSETLIDLQFEPQTIVASSKQDIIQQPKYISVKAAIPPMRVKKPESQLASVPRQVAIAPKPPKLVHVPPPKSLPGKHYAIAPKPVSLIATKTPSFKKVSIAGTMQGNMKGTTVLAQIGKQLVMVPSGSGQKIKFVASNTGMSAVQYVRSSSDPAQIIATTSKSISGTQASKPIMAKVVVQGQQNDINQPAVITKLLPSSGAGAPGPTRYVMQQKTVPINIGGNKLLLASPTKQGIKFAKKQQIIAIKSPTPKLMPATSQGNATKKVVISSNPNQNVILKTTAPPKTAQINKDGNVVVQGQRSQLHQISVPGKGIQYIRLITNPTPSVAKPTVKQQSALTIPKNFVLTDTKGNVIQMTAEKMVQPPPLVRNDAASVLAPQKKLVRIAPLNAKVTQSSMQPPRSSQSLLAPLSPMADTSTSLDNASDHTSMAKIEQDDVERKVHGAMDARDIEVDTKDHLRTLVANTLGEESEHMVNYQEIEVEYERQQSPSDEENSNSIEHNESKSMQHPLIVIPPSYIKQQHQTSQDTSGNLEDSKDLSSNIDVDGEMMRSYDMSPQASQSLSDTEYVSNELDLRPRKACNCTKSQCLKLYCDCFANGEFCNSCNCNNCHNNLENEELRQKAIRACLDRNPNAFRPKIGKAKSGGPEIVRRHNKGCNCKRSGCLKNYCECYEAKIACTATCKCVGCRNVEESLQRLRLPRVRDPRIARDPRAVFRPPPLDQFKQPCSFMTSEVIEAVCQCLVAAAAGDADETTLGPEPDPVGDVIDEFARCLQDIISASYQAIPLTLMDEGQA